MEQNEVKPNQPSSMPGGADVVTQSIQTTMEEFLAAGHVSAAYGQPIERGNLTIIPTAEVLSIAGFGIGHGESAGSAGEPAGNGGGGGGGGRVFSRPVAIIVASPEGVQIKPVVDITKIGLAALTAFGFMAATAMRMSRRPRLE